MEVRELGKSSIASVIVELLNWGEMGGDIIFRGPGKVLGVPWVVFDRVVLPGVVGLGQLLKDRALGKGVIGETGIVGAVTIGGAGQDERAVAVGWLS